MRITRIHIENFRSIKELDLYPADYRILIGPNNSGKSNILAALNLVLGEAWPTDRSFTLEDFHRYDTQHDIVIQVYFDSALETWRNMSLEVWGFELRCHAYKRAHRGMPRGTLTHDFTCLSEKGETIKYPAEPLQEGKQARLWFDLKVTGELRQQLPFIYFDARRDFFHHQTSDRWSVLRKILDVVSTEIRNDKTMVKVSTSQGEVKMTRRQAFEHKMAEAYTFLRNPDLLELEQALDSGLDQMGFGTQPSEASLHMALHHPVDPFRNIRLLVDEMGNHTVAERAGAGLQSAIIIATLMAYGEIKKEGAILAIDGPELFLHPQKIKVFRDRLLALSSGHQVLLATHCPAFIDITRPHQIWLVRREPGGGTTLATVGAEVFDTQEEQELGRHNFQDTHRNEIFFSAGVILVADSTTKFAICLVAAGMGIDLGRVGITVIDCGTKQHLLQYAKLAAGFDIPSVVIAELGVVSPSQDLNQDQPDREAIAVGSNASINDSLRTLIGEENLFWLQPDLAAILFIGRSPETQLQDVEESIRSCPAAEIPPALTRAVQRIAAMTGHKE